MLSIHVYDWKLFFKVHDCSVAIYMIKFNNRNTRTRCKICSGVFIVNFEHISLFVLACFYCLLWAGKCRLDLSFWDLALKSLAQIVIPKKSLDTSMLYCSGVIPYRFVVLSIKISRFSDDLMLLISSASFFWKSLLIGLKLADRIVSHMSLSNGDNSSCCGGVKFDLKPKFILPHERSFLSKKCAFHLNLVIKLSTYSIIFF